MTRRFSIRVIVLLLGAGGAAGCGGGPIAQATYVKPAAIPVRSFPRVWVSSGFLPEETALADGVADHLRAAGRIQVRRVELDALEPAREARQIPAATAVLLLTLQIRERSRTAWDTRPDTVCGPAGCYTRYRSFPYELPVVQARLVVTAYDGPTAKVEQRVVIPIRVEGGNYATLHDRIVARLLRRLRRMLDQVRVRVEVELLEVDEVPDVSRAVQVAQQGDWAMAHRYLQAVVDRGAARRLSAEQRARVYYNLAQSRRFDPQTLREPEVQLEGAERALNRALELDPRDRYREALHAVRRQRRELSVLLEQRKAARHNFGVGRAPSSLDIPEPPVGYRTPRPAAPPPTGVDTP